MSRESVRHVLEDGRVVYGLPESKYLHLVGRFGILDTDDGRRIWPGGRSMMPYWADGYTSPLLTDEEIELSLAEACDDPRAFVFIKQIGSRPYCADGWLDGRWATPADGERLRVAGKGAEMESWPMELRRREWPR